MNEMVSLLKSFIAQCVKGYRIAEGNVNLKGLRALTSLLCESDGRCRESPLRAIDNNDSPQANLLAAVINTTVMAGENLTVGSAVWLPAEGVAPGR